jgi:hypothetical protein
MSATTLEAEIHHVTVYRQGAVVTRVAELDAEWPQEVEVGGLPLSLLDPTVRVEVVAGDDDTQAPQPTDVRVGLALPPIEPPPPPPGEEELEAVRREIRALEAQVARLDREQSACDRLGLQLAPPPTEGPDLRPPPAPLQAWLGLIEWREAGRRQRLESRQGLQRELELAHERLAKLERQERAAKAERGPDPNAVGKRVIVRLRGGAGQGPLVLKLEYQVPGACWRPSYVLRVARDGRSAELGVRGLVAQHSGEPWRRVRLALSTADLRRDTTIPELTSLRIGRRQQTPRKASYREPPADTAVLFKGLDDALDVLGRRELPPEPEPTPDLDVYGGSPFAAPDPEAAAFARRAFEAMDRAPAADPFSAPPPPPTGAMPMASAAPGMAFGGAPPPRPSPAPQAERRRSRGRSAKKRAKGAPMRAMKSMAMADMSAMDDELCLSDSGGDWGAPSPEPELRPGELDYGQLVMRPWDAHLTERGQLRALRIRDQLRGLPSGQQSVVERLLGRARRAAGQLDGFPSGTTDVASASGAFDYRYVGSGLLDLPSDGKVHNVPLFAREAPVTLSLISVPRESDQVVRIAELKNPLVAPLLAGPADVYLEDEFLVTSPIRTVPAGASLTVGLGVEEGLKVARNTHYDEVSKGGLLGGSTTLTHRIELEVASRLSAPARVELRERVPIPDEEEKDVTVKVVDVQPPWEDFDQQDRQRIKGGKRWRFEIAAGAERTLSFTYEIQMGGKQELAGGNRRDA